MSQTQQLTGYNVSISASDPVHGGGLSIDFGVSATPVFGDAEAFALFNGIVALIPAGWNVEKELTREDTSTTNYTTNYTAVPPSFT